MCARICKPILSTFCLIAFNWHADEFEGGWAIWRRGLYSRGQIYGVQRILILFISRFRGRNPHHPQESQRKANKAKGTNSLQFLLTWQTPNRVLGNRHTNFGTKLPLAKCNKKCRNQQVRALDKSGWYDETYVCICTYKRCTYCIYMYVWCIGWFFGDPLDDDRACVQDNIFLGFIKRKNDKANTQHTNPQSPNMCNAPICFYSTDKHIVVSD